MRKLILIIAAYFLLNSSASAQANAQPSFIVKNDGDTVYGFINYRNWIKNPAEISFQTSETAPKETYDVTGIRYFEITGKDQYIRSIVWKDMMPVIITQIGNEGETKKIRDTVFLRQLAKGSRLALYELIDEKPHYYLQEGINEPIELPYRVFYDKNDVTKVVTLNTFRDQLKSYAAGQQKLINKIQRTPYKEKELTAIVLEIDNSATAIGVVSADGRPLKTSQFFAGAGLTYNNIAFKGEDYQNLNDLEASSHLGYTVKAGIDFFSKRKFQNLFFRLELAYGTYDYEGKMEREIPFVDQHEERTYKIKVNYLSPRFSVNYTFFKTQNVNVYAGIGAGYNFCSYPENILTIENKTIGRTEQKKDFLEFEKAWMEGNAQVGIIYKSLDIFIASRLAGNFANFSQIDPKFSTSCLGVCYRFKH
jgi:outer membrane protein W